MRAMIATRYGSPEVMHLTEISRPIPKEDEVLVKIHATSLNAADFEQLTGVPIIRIAAPFRPANKVLGSDFAGVVEAIGSQVTQFSVGDAVLGDSFSFGMGALAEYICVPQQALLFKPDAISFEDASTLPQAAIIALQGLRNFRDLQAGDRVLVNGGGGGMGTFAIQLAKYYGAHVTGVDSGEKLDLMRSLGADEVMNYQQEDFTARNQQYDLILDLTISHSLGEYARSLTDDGVYLAVGGPAMGILRIAMRGSAVSKGTQKTMKLLMWKQYVTEDYEYLMDLMTRQKIKAVVDKRYPLEQAADGMQYLMEGHAKGKIIVNVVDGTTE